MLEKRFCFVLFRLPSQEFNPSPPRSFKILSLRTYTPFYFIITFDYRGSCFMYGTMAEWGFGDSNKRVQPSLPERECLKNNFFSALVSYYPGDPLRGKNRIARLSRVHYLITRSLICY